QGLTWHGLHSEEHVSLLVPPAKPAIPILIERTPYFESRLMTGRNGAMAASFVEKKGFYRVEPDSDLPPCSGGKMPRSQSRKDSVNAVSSTSKTFRRKTVTSARRRK